MVVKKLTKTCPHENGEKKFLHRNTINNQIKKPYCKDILLNIFGSKAVFLLCVETQYFASLRKKTLLLCAP